jgi:hypothetical protein
MGPIERDIPPDRPYRHCRKACLTHTTPPQHATDAAVANAFAAIPALLERAPGMIARGRTLDCECLLGPTDHPFHASIRSGRIVELVPATVLMRSWRFSYRATPAAWLEYWQPEPRPGWHDLLALIKGKQAVLEGDLHPFMAHLQYFKDVLALPRLQHAAALS